MRKIVTVALCAAQMASAAQAADLGRDSQWTAQRRGAFAGARFRLPLGGREAAKPRVGLTLTPVERSEAEDGSLATRYGRGLELGLSGREPVRLTFAGRPVSRLAGGGNGPQGGKLGVSTVGWAGIVVGVVAASVVAAYVLCGTGAICDVDDD